MSREATSGLSRHGTRSRGGAPVGVLQSIAKHRRALELAINENFDGELAETEWRNAFDSTDPQGALRTMSVTGSHSAVLDAYVEILRAASGSRLLHLLPHRRPHAEQVFEAVRDDGGLSGDQVALLSAIYVLEGRLEHASPDVEAEEVREAVERLRNAPPDLMANTHDWLATHGIEF